MHSDDGGKSWVKVSKEYFVTHDKLLVSLPAPEGTSPETHAYSVVHMKDNGETETPKVNPRKDGVVTLNRIGRDQIIKVIFDQLNGH